MARDDIRGLINTFLTLAFLLSASVAIWRMSADMRQVRELTREIRDELVMLRKMEAQSLVLEDEPLMVPAAEVNDLLERYEQQTKVR